MIKSHTINTTLGSITGTSHVTFSTFFGIPYTEHPPTGNNRFRPAIKRTSSYPQTLDATDAGPACIQPREDNVSEDCLSLNIWSPDTFGSFPVMVWIHGGGFQVGSGYQHGFFSGVNFVNKDIVFVSLNYRLGALGYLPLAQIANETGTTNGGLMGIYDQIVALEWIQSYIHDYGGDSSKTTIFGESAGGLSVCTLLFSPVASGLFNKAIIESGACTGAWSALPKQLAERYIAPPLLAANGMQFNDLQSLRERDAADFINIGPLPAIDGYILRNDKILNLSSSITTLNADKIMIGGNSMDTLYAWEWYENVGPNKDISVHDGTPKTAAQLVQFLTAYFEEHDDEVATEIMSEYYNVDEFEALDLFNEYQIMWLMMSGDSCLVCPSFEFIEWIISNPMYFNGNISEDLYVYHFVGPTAPYYAKHFAEVPFVFNLDYMKEHKDIYHMVWDPTLAEHMNNMWANFVKDEDDDHMVSYGENAQNSMIFGGENGIETVSAYYNKYRNGWCPFLSTHDSSQEKLCLQNVAVDISTNTSSDQSDDTLIVVAVAIALGFIILIVIFVYLNKRYEWIKFSSKEQDPDASYTSLLDQKL